MRKWLLGVVLGLVFISSLMGCHTHHHCCEEKRDGVHIRAPYTNVNVSWPEDDDDGDVKVDVDIDD